MPIPLNNPKKRRELKIGGEDGAIVTYFHAPGDRILFDVVRGQRDAETGAPMSKDVGVRLIAEHVCEWKGFVDDETMQDVPMPGAGLLPRPPEGVRENAEALYVTDAIVDARRLVLGRPRGTSS
jgi:hypothetical protein